MLKYITANDLIESNVLKYQKDIEISNRGLASFPKNNEHDERNINKINRTRHKYKDCILSLPNIPIDIIIDDLVSSDLIYFLALGDYESADMHLIEKCVRKNDRVMDIGGGAGICACWMAKCAENEVVVIEARQDLKLLIEKNLEINNLKGKVINAALTHKNDGTIQFWARKNLWYTTIEDQEEVKDSFLVTAPSIKLEKLFDDYKPDVVLIDIEGTEQFLDFNTNHKPRNLIIEIHTPNFGGEITAKIIQNIINSGYEVKNILSQVWLFELK